MDILNNYLTEIIVIVTLFIISLKNNLQSSMLGAWVVNFIGTFFHELAHLIVSFLLNGKPTKVSLLPKKSENGYVLGYVQSSNITWYNAFPIAFAPLLLLGIALILNNYYFAYFEVSVTSYIIYIALAVIIIDNSLPSSQDIKVAFSNFGFIVYFLAFIAYYLYDKGYYA